MGKEDDLDEKSVGDPLDVFLKKANKYYKVARSKALKGVKVKIISPAVFYEWRGALKKKRGQLKMERVMKEDKFKARETFVNELSNQPQSIRVSFVNYIHDLIWKYIELFYAQFISFMDISIIQDKIFGF